MTSLIQSLFVNRANKISVDVRKNCKAIQIECAQYAATIDNAHFDSDKEKAGTDAIRAALIEAGYSWQFDTDGAPNKKGITKKIMSDHMRKIREGMLWTGDYENGAVFIDLAMSGVSASFYDFANIKKSVSKYLVLDAEYEAETEAETETDEGEGEGIESPAKRTKSEFLAWVYNQAKTEFGMDALDFAEFMESDKGRKVADDFIEAA